MANKKRDEEGLRDDTIQLRCTTTFKEKFEKDAKKHDMDKTEFAKYLYYTYKEFMQKKKEV